jgi:AraC family transcriptional activator of tynA and feaB
VRTLYTYFGMDPAASHKELFGGVFVNGTLAVEPAIGPIRMLAAAGPSYPCSFGYAEHRANVSFRRSIHHIRSDRVGQRLLHFVLDGKLEVSHAGESYTVGGGECAIVDMDSPFFCRALPGIAGTYRCSFVAIPEHVVLSRIPWATHLRSALQPSATQRSLLEGLFSILCRDAGETTRETLGLLFDAVLECLGEVERTSRRNSPAPIDITDQHFDAITRCINQHFADRATTIELVATHCRISVRYLCYILKSKGTSYSVMLWQCRLNQSRQWLESPVFACQPIARIASKAGFGSAAHFSRLFKRHFGLTPGTFRKQLRAEKPM